MLLLHFFPFTSVWYFHGVLSLPTDSTCICLLEGCPLTPRAHWTGQREIRIYVPLCGKPLMTAGCRDINTWVFLPQIKKFKSVTYRVIQNFCATNRIGLFPFPVPLFYPLTIVSWKRVLLYHFYMESFLRISL